jgi:hypothetical protein
MIFFQKLVDKDDIIVVISRGWKESPGAASPSGEVIELPPSEPADGTST